MKNKEKFKDKIVDIVCKNGNLAVDKETNEPVDCNSIDCSNCLFYCYGSCSTLLIDWANKEYKEPTVISHSDVSFLSYIPKKYEYIAREYTGELIAYDNIPSKSIDCGFWFGCNSISLGNFVLDFPMIKWTDEQPWKISDLKKLIVVNYY